MKNFLKKDIYLVVPLLTAIYSFYFYPVFLNDNNFMHFIEPAPRFNPIGIDLRWLQSVVQDWIKCNYQAKPGLTQHFPPLILVAFIWTGFLSFNKLYLVYVTLIYSLYFAIGLLFLRFLQNRYYYDLNSITYGLSFLFLGVLAYGIQFEIERGQWNLLAFLFCLAAVIFASSSDYRSKWAGYVLLTVASQIKLWPAIYIFLLISLEPSLKQKIKGFIIFIFVNFLLLFSFGFSVAVGFFNEIAKASKEQKYGIAQTSIGSFLWSIENQHLNMGNYYTIFALVVLCILIFLVVFIALFQKHQNLAILILLTSLLGLLIPTHSNDYKLSILPLVSVFLTPYFYSKLGKSTFTNFLISATVFLILISFFSFDLRPKHLLFQNITFSLLLIGCCASLLVANEIWRFSKPSINIKVK